MKNLQGVLGCATQSWKAEISVTSHSLELIRAHPEGGMLQIIFTTMKVVGTANSVLLLMVDNAEEQQMFCKPR